MKVRTNRWTSWLHIRGVKHWRALLLTVLLGSLAAGSAAALMFTSGHLISRSALRPENVLAVYVPIVLVRTFGLGKAVLQYLERLAGHETALRALSEMRAKLYRLLERQAVNLHSRYRMGDLLGLLADDIEQLQNVYLRVIFPALSGFVLYGGAVVFLADFGFFAAIWLIAYGSFWLFVVPWIAFWRANRAKQTCQLERSLLYSELSDAWYGITDWVLSGRSEHAIRSFQIQQEKARERERELRRMEWFRQWLSRCAVVGAIWLTVLWVYGRLEAGQMENIWAAACVLSVFPIMETITRVNDAFVRLPEYDASLSRLQKVEEGAMAIGEHERKEPNVSVSDPVTVQAAHVGFRYSPTSNWVLKDVSLFLPQGKKVAVLGRSGAGKSTLLQVLSGQRIPEEGQVTIDSNHLKVGHTGCFSILNQKPHLFHTSIANNIRLGRSDASDEEVRQVIRRVGLEPLIASLPQGLDTMMDEAGSRFSGGERQRIALARILLQSSPVVLLDEPTTGLDREKELDLIATLFHVLKDRTVVWFTHRLTGMERMDEILFLEDGKVKMRGTHEALMSCSERYRRLYEMDHL